MATKAKQNPYKKKLATASLDEAKAMDKAYTDALATGKKDYTHGGLKYAVQADKPRIYAADLVQKRLGENGQTEGGADAPSSFTSSGRTLPTTLGGNQGLFANTNLSTPAPQQNAAPVNEPVYNDNMMRSLGGGQNMFAGTNLRTPVPVQPQTVPVSTDNNMGRALGGGPGLFANTNLNTPAPAQVPVAQAVPVRDNLARALNTANQGLFAGTDMQTPQQPLINTPKLPDVQYAPIKKIDTKLKPREDYNTYKKRIHADLIDTTKALVSRGDMENAKVLQEMVNGIAKGTVSIDQVIAHINETGVDSNQPKFFLGGSLKNFQAGQVGAETANANIGAAGQFGAQAINMIDGADGKPSTFGSVASGALSGASSGAALGPWGMAAGAVIGGGAALFAAEKAKKAEEQALQNHMKGVTQTAEANSKQVLRNYATQGVNSQGSYAYGGSLNAQYEVEGDEMVQGQGVMLEGQQQVASDMHKAVGPSHEQGGVDGAGGERVFSDRLKSSAGKTFAKQAEHLGKRKGKYETKLASNDGAAKFTGERMAARMDEDLDTLFNEQEMKKLAQPQHSSSSSWFAYGGGIEEGKPMLNVYGQPIKRAKPVAPAYLPSEQVTARPAAGVMNGYVPTEDVGINYRPKAYESSFSNSEIYSEKTSRMLQDNNRFQKPMLAYGGGIDDPNKLVGFAVQPPPAGWAIDPRTGRPTNDLNRNGKYSNATAAFTQGEFLMPGQADTGGHINTYKNNVFSLKGSMYNAGTANPYANDRMATRSVGMPSATGLPSVPTTLTAPEIKKAGMPDAGTPQGKLAGAGFNGQYLDNLANAIATANTPKIPKPYIDQHVRLNTEFDIRPQLDSARRGRDAVSASIDANTVSSGSANANKQKLFASSVENANGLYAQKNNVEGQLKNQEIMYNNRIDQGNNQKRYAYDMADAQRRAGIASDYAQNVGNFQQDLYTAARDKKMDARDIEVAKMITMANPNLPTYGANLDMVKKQFASDPAHAKRVLDGILAESPNNAAALQLKKELGIQ